MENSESFKHFLGKALEAAELGKWAWAVMSTGEKVSVALALDQPDWLNAMGYSIPLAVDRAGSWVELIPQIWDEVRSRRQPHWQGLRETD